MPTPATTVLFMTADRGGSGECDLVELGGVVLEHPLPVLLAQVAQHARKVFAGAWIQARGMRDVCLDQDVASADVLDQLGGGDLLEPEHHVQVRAEVLDRSLLGN